MRHARWVMVSLLGLSPLALAADKGEEVELASGQVTALKCAQQALQTGQLDALTGCAPEEAKAGLVVYDVAEKQIYKLAPKKVRTFELEKAFAGGSIDFTGVVVEAKDKKDGLPVVEVKEYSITPKPKPGSFKGCL